MKTTAETEDSSALSTPTSIEEALESGFLPSDPHYRLTGKFKDAGESSSEREEEQHEQSEENQSENESASAAGKSEEEENADTAAASAAAQTEEHREEEHQEEEQETEQRRVSRRTQSRQEKLSKENRELREKLARLEGREEGRSSSSSASTERDGKQESQPAADAKAGNPRPKLDDLDPKTGKPKYATYADYEAAKDQWLQDEAIRKFQETSAKSEGERRQQEAERTIGVELNKRFEKGRSKHADFDKVALNPDLTIPRGSVTDAFLLDSDHTAEVLYYLGKHPEVLQGFYEGFDAKTGKYSNKITPQRQFRKLMEIEAEVSKAPEAAPRKPVITNAPRPPHQTSGQGGVQKDAVAQAVEDGDQETYNREQNARELARRRKAK